MTLRPFATLTGPLVVHISAVTLLILLVAVIYAPAMNGSFHFDDGINIRINSAVHMETLDVASIKRAALSGHIKSRPLANVSFAVDWWRGHGSPQPFLLTNLGIHLGVAIATYLLFVLILRGAHREGGDSTIATAAFIAAAAWALHPIQVQAVAYIVQRMASMATLFTILAVFCYIRGRRSNYFSRRWFAASAGCALLGAASKEIAWVTPMLILLAEFGLCRTRPLPGKSPMDVVLLSIPVLLAVLVIIDIATGSGPLSTKILYKYANRDFTLEQRLLTQPRVLAFHFSQLLWPLPGRFSIEHDFVTSTSLWSPWSTLPAILAVLGWGAMGLWVLFRHSGPVGFFLLWVPATLVIESSIIPLEMVFEHRMYLATTGVAGLIAMGVYWLLSSSQAKWRNAVLALSFSALAGLAFSTSSRIPHWRTDKTLYEHASTTAPNSARVWSSLAREELREGDVETAELLVRRALSLDKTNAMAQEDLGVILLDKGNIEEALKLLEKAVVQMVPNARVFNHLGEAYIANGRFEDAITVLKTAVSLSPELPNPHWNLALAYSRSNNCHGESRQWNRYLELETNESDRALVHEHLEERFRTPGAPCFGEKARQRRKTPT